MNVKYQIWWRAATTLELLPAKAFTERICFAFLYNEVWAAENKENKFLEIRFSNKMGEYEEKNISTEEWIGLFIKDLENKIVSWRIEKDFFYVTLDLSILSYEWTLSILTLFRYAGEFYNICWLTKYILDCTKLNAWEALFVAHQVEIEECPLKCNYGTGHSLFTPGNSLSFFNQKEVFYRLDKLPAYHDTVPKGYSDNEVQNNWYPNRSYNGKIKFDRSMYA